MAEASVSVPTLKGKVTAPRGVRRRRRRRKRIAEIADDGMTDKQPTNGLKNALSGTDLKGGLRASILQSANRIVMLKVLRDIKRELAEQKRLAQERLHEDSQEIADADGTANGSYSESSSIDEDAGSTYAPIEFEDRQQAVPKCTILHYSPFKAVWDWIILLLVLYTAVFTPYIVAFLINETDTLMQLNTDQVTRLKNAQYKTVDPLVMVDLVVDLMFIVDIVINFRTTYVKGGEVVSNSRDIAINYLKGWFVIDAIAAIPFDLLFFGSGTSDTLTATGILKLARLLRLLRVARRADQYSQYAAATLLLMMITFALIAHWLACIFYAVAYMERKTLRAPIGWLDTLAVQLQMPYIANDTTSGPDLQSRYVTAMYFTMTALTSIGFGNVAPNTNAEKIFSIFAMLIGSLMSAAIFGNFSSIMMRMYQGSEEMQQKTRSITDFIKFHTIPGALSKRMHDAFLHSWSDTNGVDMNSVLKSFPEQIQADICLHLNKNLLNNNLAFKGASPGCLRALSLRFTTTHAPPGDNLIHLGDVVNSIYFIARGTIEILKDDICMAILGRGDIFGISVDDLSNVVKSNYSVHALTFCDMNKIDAYDLQDIFDMYPEFTENFKKKFSLTFNLKMGEYATLITPPDMDEETLKLIRQKRPRMQCKGPTTNQLAIGSLHEETDSSNANMTKLVKQDSKEEAMVPRMSVVELTPAGITGRTYQHSPHQTRRKDGAQPTLHSPAISEMKAEETIQDRMVNIAPKELGDEKPSDIAPVYAKPCIAEAKPCITEAKPNLRQILLTAAGNLSKPAVKTAAPSNEASPLNLAPEPLAAASAPAEHKPSMGTTPAERMAPAAICHKVEVIELKAISDRINDCMARAHRVENHWNQNVDTILRLLGHDPMEAKKSFV